MPGTSSTESIRVFRLPERAYLEHLRIILNKYRRRNKVGFLSLSKVHLIPMAKEDPRFSEDDLSIDVLKRKLEYWAGGERGELRDAKVAWLVEQFILLNDPDSLDQFNSNRNLERTGQVIADFVSVDSEFRSIHIIEKRIEEYPKILPRIYGGMAHYRLQRGLCDNEDPGRILVIADHGSNDFYSASFFQYDPAAESLGDGWRMNDRFCG